MQLLPGRPFLATTWLIGLGDSGLLENVCERSIFPDAQRHIEQREAVVLEQGFTKLGPQPTEREPVKTNTPLRE